MAKESTESPPVRLQIPVSEELATAISQLAERMERSQAWLCARLLEAIMKDVELVGNWLRRRAIGKGTEMRRMGWRQNSKSPMVRLQVTVPEKLANRIDDLASRLNHTQVSMAALLLDCAVDDNEWVIRMVTSPIGKMIKGWVGRVRGKPTRSVESRDSE